MQACLNQAERMAKEVSLSSDKSSGAHSPSAPAPSSRGTSLPLDHSIDLVRLERSGRQRAATKKRRLARHGKNATLITPRGDATAPHNADDDSVISDTPVQNNRKRKLRSGASLAISEATSVGIVLHDNDL